MARKEIVPLTRQPPPDSLIGRVRFPLAIVMGSPAEVIHFLNACPRGETVCYQIDLYQAGRLQQGLLEAGIQAEVRASADLWDLGPHFASAVYLPARSGEREFKIDLVEQGFHILAPSGQFVVWSCVPNDRLFPDLMKKVYKKVHLHSEEESTVLWSQKNSEHPRRRHEVTFQSRVAKGEAARFLSRPGTFSYGLFDEGARALCEAMSIRPGQKIIDIGCGCGTNGIFAWMKARPDGHITFVDSNLRAVELARINAEANGVAHFEAHARANLEGFLPRSFDIALANPPYFANHSIGRLFIERSRELIKANGSFFMVTKQPNEMVELMTEVGFEVEGGESRGYTVMMHRGPAAREDMQASQ